MSVATQEIAESPLPKGDARRRGVRGRKFVGEDKLHFVGYRFPKRVVERINEEAKLADTTPSGWVRDLVTEAIDRRLALASKEAEVK